MIAKRVAAFLIAAALIVAALLIRNGLDDNSSESTDGTNAPSGGKIVVICSTEFEAVCNGLGSKYDVQTEPAGQTLDRLAKDGAVLPDAWITLDPFPGMVDALRQVANVNPSTPTITAAATDAPELAVAKAVEPGVATLCGGVNWKCAGTNAGKTLDTGAKLLPGIADPRSESNGLLAFANAVAGYFDNGVLSASSWDDLAFGSWLRTVKSKVNVVAAGASPLSTLITRKTIVNVAATTASEVALSPQPGQFTATPVTPAIGYTAVVATYGSRTASLPGLTATALVAAGWTRVVDAPPLLDAGTFVALRRLWEGK